MESKHQKYQEIGLMNASREPTTLNSCSTLTLKNFVENINMVKIQTNPCS